MRARANAPVLIDVSDACHASKREGREGRGGRRGRGPDVPLSILNDALNADPGSVGAAGLDGSLFGDGRDIAGREEERKREGRRTLPCNYTAGG